MFPSRYFAHTYFAPRYFPPVTDIIQIVVITCNFVKDAINKTFIRYTTQKEFEDD